MHILLEESEIARLKRRVSDKTRERAVAPGDGRIFSDAGLIAGVKDARKPKWAIEQIILETTDVPLTFHHLRHSFASYLTTTLLLPHDYPAAPIPLALKSVISFERKGRVFGPLLGDQKLGQHALHAVSQIMGHIVNETTVQWYGHLLDITRLHYVARPVAEALLPAKAVIAMTGLSRPLPPVIPESRVPAEAGVSMRRDKSLGYRKPAIAEDASEQHGNTRLLRVSTQRGRLAAGWERKFAHPSPRSIQATPTKAQREPEEVGGHCWRTIFAALESSDADDPPCHPEAACWRQSAHIIRSLKQKSGLPRHAFQWDRHLASTKWVPYLQSRWPKSGKLRAAERRALFSAIERWDPSRNGVRFPGRPTALAFRDLLLGCEFTHDEIQIKLTGASFRRYAAEDFHDALANADWLPGCARTRGRRGTIGIYFRGHEVNARHVKSAGHFLLVMLAIREGYGFPR